MDKAPKSYDGHLAEFRQRAYVKSVEEYEEFYRQSMEDVDSFWSQRAREYLSWEREWDFVLRHDVEEARVEWFGGGLLNAAFNCLDRHLDYRKDKVAYYWEGDDPSQSRTITYGELYTSVNRLAALLRSRGVQKGDRVVIYLPMIVELPISMLACARIGAIHCVIHVHYSGQWLGDRIQDCRARAVITADGGRQGGMVFPLKQRVDEALQHCPEVDMVLVFDRCGLSIDLAQGRDIYWNRAIEDSSLPDRVPPESMSAEDPLFILFASGNTGKPRALMHTHAGYLLWAAMTSRLVFDIKEDDVFWCPSDLGWLTGHSLSVYGPLVNGFSVVLFEGVPSYPDYDRYWQIVDRYRVTTFCTEPTVIRVLAVQGTEPIERHRLSSLRLLASCGEPMKQQTWEWYHREVGKGRCPIIDTWWQTESGGPMMTPLPGVHAIKAGSVASPFFGVKPVILDLDTGEETRFPNQEGAFFIGSPWPGMARTIFDDHAGYVEAYFAPFPGMFITGDGAKIDDDGYYWITGRIDDVINVSGHRIGAWEIETALVAYQNIAEAAVVGFPHPIKGQGLYAFVTLSPGTEISEALKEELRLWLSVRIGTIAVPDVLQWAQQLPKTRSGKILRRLLQKIAAGQVDDLGDTTTLANPDSIAELVKDRIGIST